MRAGASKVDSGKKFEPKSGFNNNNKGIQKLL